jgi:PAS domain S-box-containing protein
MAEKWELYRKKIIGLGETSMKKSYYPELQKKIEDLEGSQGNLQSIFNSISDGIIVHDERGKILSINKSAKKLFNIDEEEITRVDFFKLCGDKEIRSILSSIWQKVLKGKSKAIDWKIKNNQTGDVTIVQVVFNRIVWDSQKSLVAVIRDITEQKLYEQKIIEARERAEQSEDLYRSIVDLSPEGIMTMSLKGIILTVNKSFIKYGGYEEADFVGKSFLKIPTLIKQDLPTYKKIFSQIIRGSIDKAIEFKWKHKSGDIYYGEVHVAIIKKGRKSFILGIIRNITESKIAREQLRKSEERYNLALQAVNEGIWDWNVEEDKVYFDSRYYTIAGYEHNEFPHNLSEWQKRIHPNDVEYCLSLIQSNLLRKAETFDMEFRFLRKDGAWMWIRGRGKTVERNNRGMAKRIIGTHSDITDRKNLEADILNHKENLEFLVKERTEALEAANEELTSINEELFYQRKELEKALMDLKDAQKQIVISEKMASIGVLTAGIAHEINNPINFISSGTVGLEMQIDRLLSAIREYTNLSNVEKSREELDLMESIDSKYEVTKAIENIPKLIKTIHAGVERTTAIVKGLRTFSRMDEESKVFAHINELINSTLTILYNKYKNRIEVQTFFDEKDNVMCFPGKMGQLFLNLFINSIQSIEGQGAIKIETASDDTLNLFKVVISDTGSGMSEEVQKRIFDPFYTTKPIGQGTGLGLAIVHGIVNEHNGKIEVSSAVGKGTTVTVTIPKN